jgi:thioredoxin-related protein
MISFKKILPCSIALFFSASNLQADAQGIEFVHSLDSALMLAKAQNKPIFIDFYTSWCAPCKVMTAEVFPQAKVGTYFNSQFINCKIQCDDKGIGVKMGEKYQVNAYPTLMFLDAKGELIHSMAGGISAEELIDLGNIARDPSRNLLSLLTQWKNGRRDTAFVNLYFGKLKEAYRNELAKKQFEQYFKTLSQKEKTSTTSFSLIKLLGYPPSSPIFGFVEDNLASYDKTVGEVTVTDFIKNSYAGNLRAMIFVKGGAARNQYFESKAKLRSRNYSSYDEIAMYLSVFETFDSTGKVDIKEYQARGTAFLDRYGKDNDGYTLGLTSLLGNCTGRENEGAAGIQWMENLLARKRDPRYLPAYFYILWRNYQFDKAITVGEEMKANAIRENRPTRDIEAQIKMISDYKEKINKQKMAGS